MSLTAADRATPANDRPTARRSHDIEIGIRRWQPSRGWRHAPPPPGCMPGVSRIQYPQGEEAPPCGRGSDFRRQPDAGRKHAFALLPAALRNGKLTLDSGDNGGLGTLNPKKPQHQPQQATLKKGPSN
jgi:hypothetical protein